jgi:hypothetical protein
VAQHRAEIEAVAEALMEDETLADGEADFIMDCIAEGKDWRVGLTEYRRMQELSRLDE